RSMSAFEKTWAPLTHIARRPRAAAPRTAFSIAFLTADRSVSSESSARGTVDSITTVRAHAGGTLADISSRTRASGTRGLMARSLSKSLASYEHRACQAEPISLRGVPREEGRLRTSGPARG